MEEKGADLLWVMDLIYGQKAREVTPLPSASSQPHFLSSVSLWEARVEVSEPGSQWMSYCKSPGTGGLRGKRQVWPCVAGGM